MDVSNPAGRPVTICRKQSSVSISVLPVGGLADALLALPGELGVGDGLEDHVGARAGVALAAVPQPREDGRLRAVALRPVRLGRRARLAGDHRRVLLRVHHAVHAGSLPDDLKGQDRSLGYMDLSISWDQ